MENTTAEDALNNEFWIYENEKGKPVFGIGKEDKSRVVLFKKNGSAVPLNTDSLDSKQLEFEWKHLKKVPYNVPQIMKSSTVWLTEDEKTASRISQILPDKHCSSAIPGGISKWKKHYRQIFAGKTVVLLCGREYLISNQILADLEGVCSVKEVRLICKDVYNWIVNMQVIKSSKDVFAILEEKSFPEDDFPNMADQYPFNYFECNDFGRRDSFLKAYGDVFKNSSDGSIYIYQDGIWVPDQKLGAMNLAENWIKSIKSKYEYAEDGCARKEIKALMTGNKARMLVNKSAYDSNTRIEKEQFEANPFLINFENGTLDVSTENHIFREHQPEDSLLYKMDFPYNPFAESPVFMKFISDIFSKNQDLIDYFQELIGYFMTGLAVEPIVMILYGGGKNGKSTLCNLIEELTASYAKRVRIQAFMDKSADSIPNDLASTAGKRIIIGSEMKEDQRLNESLLKDLTGNDKISARSMRKEFFEFKPVGKILLYGNHKPYIRGTDLGIRRRLKMFHLTSEFSNEKQDRFLPEKLRNEFPGICNWFLEGLKRLKSRGYSFIEPQEIKNNVADLMEESDSVGQFLNDTGYAITESEDDQVIIKNFYNEYLEFCRENRIRPYTKPKFSQYLRTRGAVTKAGSGNIQKYVGIGKCPKILNIEITNE